jgi:hypothetical protein
MTTFPNLHPNPNQMRGWGQDVDTAIAGALTDVVVDSFAFAALPDATENEGRIIYSADSAAGSPTLLYSNGTNWLRVALGIAAAGA